MEEVPPFSLYPYVESILIVEDDDDHAEILRRALRVYSSSPSIDRVKSGVEALKYLRREEPYQDKPRPSLIFLDLKLPRMDGHEVLSAIKGDPEFADILVFILSTSDAEIDRLKAKDNRANRYLIKPTEPASFRKLIEDLKI